MREAKALPGICEMCGYSGTRTKMSGHLATCAPEHDAAGSADDLMRLQVEASGAPEYLLQIEVRNRQSCPTGRAPAEHVA